MLPPFHSLGLTGNIALPLAFGLPAVYYANPTEGARLAALTRRWKPTITVAPPTFLDGMLRKARPGDSRFPAPRVRGSGEVPRQRVCGLCRGSSRRRPVRRLRGDGMFPGHQCEPSRKRPSRHHRPAAAVREGCRRVCGRGTAPCGSRRTGMLLVSGPNVFGGYLGVDADKQPFVAFEGMEWYRTGDLVSEAAHGCLTFRGRLKRFVKVGGEMISLPQIRERACGGFRRGTFRRIRRTGPRACGRKRRGRSHCPVHYARHYPGRGQCGLAGRAPFRAVRRRPCAKTGVYPGSWNRKDRLQGAQGVLRLRRLVRGEVHSEKAFFQGQPALEGATGIQDEAF